MSETRTLSISALGHRGEGIGRAGEEAVYIPLTLAGETVTAEITGNRGRLLDINEPSPDRAQPICAHYGACGGCQLQHMKAAAYGQFKRDLVASALERARVSAEVAPPVIAHGAGRRRVTLHATRDGAGFMGLRSHDIHFVDRCPILVPALAGAPEVARDFARIFGSCDVAFTASDAGIDVAVKGKGLRPSPDIADLARRHDLARVALNDETVYMVGHPAVTMGKATVPLPVGSFLQATGAAESELAARVCAAAEGFRSVADLFSGLGPFALRLAEGVPVYAADSDRPAIAALQKAARGASGLKPVTAERRDLFREPLTPFELNRFDCVVLDPPRAGARAQTAELARSKVGRVIYVSCDPQSFARDAAVLVDAGYTLGTVTPIDQFAFSAHVELFAVFDRRGR